MSKMYDPSEERITRRDFLKRSTLGIAGLGLAWAGLSSMSNPQMLFAALENDPAIQKGRMYYRKLGKTGLTISEVAFNGALAEDTSVLSYAIDHGLNYVDTAPSYGNTEEIIGQVLKYRRNDLYVSTKWDVQENMDPKKLEESVMLSLKRLNIDTIDIIQIWAARRKTQVLFEPMFEVFDKLKKDGKVRFLGVSSHINTEDVMRAVIDCERFDMMTILYNYKNHEKMASLIEEASAKNIGMIAQFIEGGMESIPGAGKGTLRGALEWVLSNRNIASAIMPMRSTPQADEFLYVPSMMRK
ncbi:MAG: aldo/keto reductase [Candidatus Auribacterota bacterium]|jgi:aryl-alcohol dehydrogenase-like predicted oxidoreductase|nr:aldo/keto reductase [Candidatus Auribacterota bacterium]